MYKRNIIRSKHTTMQKIFGFYGNANNLLFIFLIINVILFNEHLTKQFVNGAIDVLNTDADATTLAMSHEVTIITTTPSLPMLPTKSGSSSPPLVLLNKCCHYGSYLDATRTCVPGNSELWVPLIFLINRRITYAKKGKSPSFMQFKENVLPIGSNELSEAQEGCATIDDLEYFNGNGKFVIFSNGSLFLHKYSQLVEPRHYCVDRESALVCFPKKMTTQSPRIRLRKCCGKFGSYDAVAKTCAFSAGETHANLQLPIDEARYQTLYGFPDCHEESSTSYAIAGDWRDAQFDQTTGYVQLQHKNYSTTDYCLEHFNDGNDSAATMAVKIFVCLHHFATNATENASASAAGDHLQVAVLNFGLVISVVFLAATLIAGYLMPSVHHMLHWRCQIYYVFSLFVGDFLLAYSQLSNSIELGSTACLVVASAMHFFFLAAFFWLNTMCFNIWWTFRDFRPSSLERNQEVLRLRLYSAYAWGIPLLISIIAAFVDQLPESTLLRPGFGISGCWFSGDRLSIFAYFFAPVGILLCLNIVLFVSTTHQLTCGLWKRDDVKSTTEKTALGKVCLKLVVVMGVTWIAEIISWIVGGPHSAWFFTDLINALQGVFIFIVVGCQPQVWAACKRYCCPRARQEITNTTNGVQHSSSSQGLPSMGHCGAAEITQNTSVNNTTILSTTSTNTNNIQSPAAPTKIPMETVC